MVDPIDLILRIKYMTPDNSFFEDSFDEINNHCKFIGIDFEYGKFDKDHLTSTNLNTIGYTTDYKKFKKLLKTTYNKLSYKEQKQFLELFVRDFENYFDIKLRVFKSNMEYHDYENTNLYHYHYVPVLGFHYKDLYKFLVEYFELHSRDGPEYLYEHDISEEDLMSDNFDYEHVPGIVKSIQEEWDEMWNRFKNW